jgi:predicted aldo/keto reductase-like oxidoreductase
MAKPLAYLASAGLMGLGAEGLLKAAGSASAAKLIMRPLGKTGISLPIVSMGVMNAEAPGLIIKSYEVGIRHFDTAAGYQGGRNEEMVGQVIRQLGVRDKVVISTKAHVRGTGDADPGETKAALLKVFEGSLSRLQMDHVETLYLHGVHNAKSVNDAGVQAAMTQLKKEGKIRWCGVSTHGGQADVLNALAQSGFFDVTVVAFNYTMADNQALLDAMQLCASKGIGITAMKTQAGGSNPKRQETYANEAQKSVRQTAVLKWVLQHPFITTAIPGFTKFEQIDEDIPVASNIAFTDDERNFLSNNAIKASLEFCQQCGDCCQSCCGGADVPTLMRTHMYAFDYQNLEHARITLAEVEKGKGLDACGCCTCCTAKCSHTVNIRRKIEALKTIRLT